MQQSKVSVAHHAQAYVRGQSLTFASPSALAAHDYLLPVERAYAIHYSGQPYAVMMLSPQDTEDFAIGFSLTEGVIDSPTDIRAMELRDEDDSTIIDIQLHPDRFKQHLARQRSLSGRSSCGMCGITHIDDITRATPRSTRAPLMPTAAAIHHALTHIDAHQPLNKHTRAVHAAAWCDSTGTILCAREDVGRHNALDKLIGALACRQIDVATGFALITSRCSFEMVEKAASVGIGTLVAISAPTSLALERAKNLGMNIIAIARPDSAIIFHHQRQPEGAMSS